MATTVILGDIGYVITGKTPPKSNPDYWGYDLDFITPTDFTDSRYVTPVRKLSAKGAEAMHRVLCPANSVIVTCIGSDMGKVALSKKPYISNQQINTIVINPMKADASFIYYLIKFNRPLLRKYAESGGSTMPIINKSTFEKLEFDVPELDEQKKIADILGTIDEKIELNRRMNETLERIGQSLFKQFFISNPETANWKDKILREILEIRNGCAFKSGDYVASGIPVVRTTNFTNNGTVLLDDVVYLTEENAEKYKNFQLVKQDLLVVMVGASLGKTVRVPSNILPALQNQNMWCFRAKLPEDQNFISYKMVQLIKENIGSGSGSAREFFRKDYFYKLIASYPSKHTLNLFNLSINPIIDKMDDNISEIQTLITLRDSLLPRLISGKIKS